MKKILKILGWGLGVVVLAIAVGVCYLFLRFPDVVPVNDFTSSRIFSINPTLVSDVWPAVLRAVPLQRNSLVRSTSAPVPLTG